MGQLKTCSSLCHPDEPCMLTEDGHCDAAAEDHDDDDEPICSACNGSGEGMYDGSTCYKCKGYGHERPERNDEP